jgi:hypothetical protein
VRDQCQRRWLPLRLPGGRTVLDLSHRWPLFTRLVLRTGMEEEGSVVAVEELREEGPRWPTSRLAVGGSRHRRRRGGRETTEPPEHGIDEADGARLRRSILLCRRGSTSPCRGWPPWLPARVGGRQSQEWVRPAELAAAAEGAEELAMASASEGREQEPPLGA